MLLRETPAEEFEWLPRNLLGLFQLLRIYVTECPTDANRCHIQHQKMRDRLQPKYIT